MSHVHFVFKLLSYISLPQIVLQKNQHMLHGHDTRSWEGRKEETALAQRGNSVLINKLPALLRHTPLTFWRRSFTFKF
jgi:hypothetical protein